MMRERASSDGSVAADGAASRYALVLWLNRRSCLLLVRAPELIELLLMAPCRIQDHGLREVLVLLLFLLLVRLLRALCRPGLLICAGIDFVSLIVDD